MARLHIRFPGKPDRRMSARHDGERWRFWRLHTIAELAERATPAQMAAIAGHITMTRIVIDDLPRLRAARRG